MIFPRSFRYLQLNNWTSGLSPFTCCHRLHAERNSYQIIHLLVKFQAVTFLMQAIEFHLEAMNVKVLSSEQLPNYFQVCFLTLKRRRNPILFISLLFQFFLSQANEVFCEDHYDLHHSTFSQIPSSILKNVDFLSRPKLPKQSPAFLPLYLKIMLLISRNM